MGTAENIFGKVEKERAYFISLSEIFSDKSQVDFSCLCAPFDIVCVLVCMKFIKVLFIDHADQ